jgi:hypothetical protein
VDAREEFYRRIGRMLKRAQDQGLARRDMNSELAAVLLGGMTEYYAYMWFVEERSSELDIPTVALQITSLWERGAFGGDPLAPPPVEHA